MNYITTTQLRTKTSDLVSNILAGQSVQLTHRSQVIATISPTIGKPAKPFDGKKYLEETKHLKTSKLTDKQRENNYREYLKQKYG